MHRMYPHVREDRVTSTTVFPLPYSLCQETRIVLNRAKHADDRRVSESEKKRPSEVQSDSPDVRKEEEWKKSVKVTKIHSNLRSSIHTTKPQKLGPGSRLTSHTWSRVSQSSALLSFSNWEEEDLLVSYSHKHSRSLTHTLTGSLQLACKACTSLRNVSPGRHSIFGISTVFAASSSSLMPG